MAVRPSVTRFVKRSELVAPTSEQVSTLNDQSTGGDGTDAKLEEVARSMWRSWAW